MVESLESSWGDNRKLLVKNAKLKKEMWQRGPMYQGRLIRGPGVLFLLESICKRRTATVRIHSAYRILRSPS